MPPSGASSYYSLTSAAEGGAASLSRSLPDLDALGLSSQQAAPQQATSLSQGQGQAQQAQPQGELLEVAPGAPGAASAGAFGSPCGPGGVQSPGPLSAAIAAGDAAAAARGSAAAEMAAGALGRLSAGPGAVAPLPQAAQQAQDANRAQPQQPHQPHPHPHAGEPRPYDWLHDGGERAHVVALCKLYLVELLARWGVWCGGGVKVCILVYA